MSSFNLRELAQNLALQQHFLLTRAVSYETCSETLRTQQMLPAGMVLYAVYHGLSAEQLHYSMERMVHIIQHELSRNIYITLGKPA